MEKRRALFLDAGGEGTDYIKEKYRSNDDDDDEIEKRDLKNVDTFKKIQHRYCTSGTADPTRGRRPLQMQHQVRL